MGHGVLGFQGSKSREHLHHRVVALRGEGVIKEPCPAVPEKRHWDLLGSKGIWAHTLLSCALKKRRAKDLVEI